uniref:DUF6570 domain-containing protein n=1 Tax=Amphimedon queenslandica TaxID=400682 RepID=A0A1X7VSQ7_AMPQE
MHVDKIPPELSRLNTMEQRLISRVQAFMKLIVLPLGQRALAGQTINFPANVSEVFNSLPRPLNSDGVVLVKPPESTSASVSVQSGDQTDSTSSGPEMLELVPVQTVLVLTLHNQAHLLVLETYL